MTNPARPEPDPQSVEVASVARGSGTSRLKTAAIVQVVAGVFLLLLMGTVTWRMAPILLAAPAPLADGSRFNASQEVAQMVLALFGSVMAFGALALFIGLRQLATGVRPLRVFYLLLANTVLIVVLGLLTVFAIKAGR